VPEHESGRLFRDLLGRLNAQAATACDRVELVVAGRVITL
jgi:adenosylcobinamide kinase/adenosylcobinamide-phosphate guanylyltransferase